MAFLPFHEDPKIQKRMFFNLENKILTTFPKSDREIYTQALHLYRKETNDDNLYISDDTYDIDGSLRPNLCALQYNERNDDWSRFWKIYDIFKYKKIINKYEKDAKIEIFLKPTNGGCLPQDHEYIIGKLINNNEEHVEVKLDKNGELRIIKYTDIALIDEDL
ncbi:hypothetical protein [uncultured Clostridium sp.]|uniref:hypothetical protein n=1 Tax=uncultured Clostridium sp. TaxID=59620 RepID=UPI0028F0B663|nr:hypothetical protein [uncultured Clostridium sp.]